MQTKRIYESPFRWLIVLYFAFFYLISYTNILPAPVWKSATIVGYVLLMIYNRQNGISNKVLLRILFLAGGIFLFF